MPYRGQEAHEPGFLEVPSIVSGEGCAWVQLWTQCGSWLALSKYQLSLMGLALPGGTAQPCRQAVIFTR